MSSFGNAPSRQKSIDVEFNLLRNWSEARLDLQRRLAQRIALGLVVVATGLVVLPILASARNDALVQTERAVRESKAAVAASAAKAAQAELVRPAVERETEILASALHIDGLLSALATVLNAAPETLIVRNLQFEVTGGLLTVRIHAQAPDGNTARSFARRVSASAGIQGAKASSITQDGDGVSFDFTSTGEIAL